MAKYDGYLICSDLDGTLTNSYGKISEKNSEAIKCFQENGGLFTVATGRYHDYLYKFKDDFKPNTYVVSVNGTMICDMEKNEIIYSKAFDEDIDHVLDYVFSNFDFIRETRIHLADDSLDYTDLNKHNFRQVFSKINSPIYKLIFCTPEDNCILLRDGLIEKFGNMFNFNRSWAHGLEMHSKKSGKGELILKLKQLLNREIHTVICVGDYENDISMIKMADIGYAVENAVDLVKQHADKITVSNNDDAIAKIIYDL